MTLCLFPSTTIGLISQEDATSIQRGREHGGFNVLETADLNDEGESVTYEFQNNAGVLRSSE